VSEQKPSSVRSSEAGLEKPLTKVRVRLVGEDGNTFAVIGRVRRALRQAGHADLAAKYTEEAMSGDYNNVLRTTMKYVSVY